MRTPIIVQDVTLRDGMHAARIGSRRRTYSES